MDKGQVYTIEFTAEDPDGSITLVEVFVDDILAGSLSNPASTSLNMDVTIGSTPTNEIKVKAVDNEGAKDSVSVIVNVNDPNPLTVSITAPATGSFDLNTITITAGANDVDEPVQSVEFFKDAVSLGIDNNGSDGWSIEYIPAEGTVNFTAKATNSANATAVSDPVSVTFVNSPPTLSITSPEGGFNLYLGADTTFIAYATDPDGTVSNVVFILNGDIVYTDDTPSDGFSYTYVAGTPAGQKTLTVRATDNMGAQAISDLLTFHVVSLTNIPPTVSIQTPSENDVFTTGEEVVITADAGDEEGTVDSVVFYLNDSRLGMDNEAPFEFRWTAIEGTHEITVMAWDNEGASTLAAPVTIMVIQNEPPVVTITSPGPGAEFNSGDEVTISIDASDDGTVDSVEVFVNAVKVGVDFTEPYLVKWIATEGMKEITATAWDNHGASTASPGLNINVIRQNIPPTISITSPAQNDVFIGGTFHSITMNASDDGTIDSVVVMINHARLVADYEAPFTVNWKAEMGDSLITATAWDNDGASTTTDPIKIKVKAPNNHPVVSIVSPEPGASYKAGKVIVIKVNATDNDGTIDSVAVFVNGTKTGSDAAYPYEVNWLTIEGSASITARAWDDDSDSTTSAEVIISITAPNELPQVNITSPVSTDVFFSGEWVQLSADAHDSDGIIDSVEFYVNGNKKGTDLTPPYSYEWLSAAGSNTITAKAYDNDSDVTTSPGVTVQVNQNLYPVVSILQPHENDTVSNGDIVTLIANASDDFGIDSVQFRINDVRIGSDQDTPYELNWTAATTGDKVVTAVAYDVYGVSTTSSAVNFYVKLRTGISPVKFPDVSLLIFPNPVQGQLNIKLTNGEDINSPVEISVYNLLGNKLLGKKFSITGRNNIDIDFSGHPAGVYLIQVVINGHTYSQRFINK